MRSPHSDVPQNRSHSTGAFIDWSTVASIPLRAPPPLSRFSTTCGRLASCRRTTGRDMGRVTVAGCHGPCSCSVVTPRFHHSQTVRPKLRLVPAHVQRVGGHRRHLASGLGLRGAGHLLHPPWKRRHSCRSELWSPADRHRGHPGRRAPRGPVAVPKTRLWTVSTLSRPTGACGRLLTEVRQSGQRWRSATDDSAIDHSRREPLARPRATTSAGLTQGRAHISDKTTGSPWPSVGGAVRRR